MCDHSLRSEMAGAPFSPQMQSPGPEGQPGDHLYLKFLCSFSGFNTGPTFFPQAATLYPSQPRSITPSCLPLVHLPKGAPHPCSHCLNPLTQQTKPGCFRDPAPPCSDSPLPMALHLDSEDASLCLGCTSPHFCLVNSSSTFRTFCLAPLCRKGSPSQAT